MNVTEDKYPIIPMDKETYMARFKTLTGSEAPADVSPDDSFLVPHILSDRSKFNLSICAIMLYSLMLDKAVRTYQQDGNGYLFFTYQIEEGMDMLHCTKYAVTKAVNDLVKADLIFKYYDKLAHETRYYICLPSDVVATAERS